MLSSEAERRLPVIEQDLDQLAAASEPDPEALERIRVEVHGLRGAAMVIGESRLAELAERVERVIADRIPEGTIETSLATRLNDSLRAFGDGAAAAASRQPEPPSVAESLGALG